MKKLISIVLVVLLIAGVVAGCSRKETPSTPTSTESTAKVTNTAQEPVDQEPADQGPAPVIKWYVAGDKAPDFDMVLEDLNKDLKEKINVQLDLQMIPGGEFNDKMKLISTSGEDYDLVFTSSWRNSFLDNMAREAFMPLDDFLASDAGKPITEVVPQWVLDVAKVNGKIYAVPNMQMLAYQQAFVIQKAYVDKYNLDVASIKKFEDIEPFLKMIKENEPDLIPLKHEGQAHINIIKDSNAGYDLLAGYNVYVKRGDTTLTAINAATSEANIAQTKQQNDWYKKGYYRQDILTAIDDSADQKANKYVVYYNTHKPGGVAEVTAKYGVEYISIPIGTPYIEYDSGIATMTAMNVNSKNPEAAMKLLACVHTDKDIFNKLLFGLEGVHYTKSAPDRVEPVADTKYNYGTSAWALGNQFNAWYLPGQLDGVWEETDKMNRDSKVSLLRGFTFDPTSVQAELAQLGAIAKEYNRGLYVAEDIEAWIKEVNDKQAKAGIDKVVAETQRQIDEWAKANGKK